MVVGEAEGRLGAEVEGAIPNFLIGDRPRLNLGMIVQFRETLPRGSTHGLQVAIAYLSDLYVNPQVNTAVGSRRG